MRLLCVTMSVLGIEPGFPQEQQALVTTEPSLQVMGIRLFKRYVGEGGIHLFIFLFPFFFPIGVALSCLRPLTVSQTSVWFEKSFLSSWYLRQVAMSSLKSQIFSSSVFTLLWACLHVDRERDYAKLQRWTQTRLCGPQGSMWPSPCYWVGHILSCSVVWEIQPFPTCEQVFSQSGSPFLEITQFSPD